MIDGVKIKKLTVHTDVLDTNEIADKLGILMEVIRADEGIMTKFGQSTMTISYKGTIKAFHWHKIQDDIWFVATGKVRVVLYDFRRNSKTFKETQVILAGADDYKVIVIPPGVVHGYKVLSDEPAILFYHTTEVYDAQNPDEKRLPYNDSSINYDWDQND